MKNVICAAVVAAMVLLCVAICHADTGGGRHHRPMSACHSAGERAMSPEAFGRLVEMVNGQAFDDEKFMVIEAASLGGWFSCSQAAVLMSCFKWDDEKLKVLGFLSPRLIDICDADAVFSGLTFDSSKKKAWEIIARPCPR